VEFVIEDIMRTSVDFVADASVEKEVKRNRGESHRWTEFAQHRGSMLDASGSQRTFVRIWEQRSLHTYELVVAF